MKKAVCCEVKRAAEERSAAFGVSAVFGKQQYDRSSFRNTGKVALVGKVLKLIKGRAA